MGRYLERVSSLERVLPQPGKETSGGLGHEPSSPPTSYEINERNEITPPDRPAAQDASTLLAWASELAEQEMVLDALVTYVEAPQRAVTTARVSWYAGRYLKTIVSARLYREHPRLCWGEWTPAWWQEREREALYALASLKRAVGGLLQEKAPDRGEEWVRK